MHRRSKQITVMLARPRSSGRSDVPPGPPPTHPIISLSVLPVASPISFSLSLMRRLRLPTASNSLSLLQPLSCDRWVHLGPEQSMRRHSDEPGRMCAEASHRRHSAELGGDAWPVGACASSRCSLHRLWLARMEAAARAVGTCTEMAVEGMWGSKAGAARRPGGRQQRGELRCSGA